MNSQSPPGGGNRHHPNARLTYVRRRELAQRAAIPGVCVAALARQFGVSRQTVYKWRRRLRGEGLPGLHDRSSRPHRSPNRLPRCRQRQIVRARHRRWSSLRIAQHYGLPLSSVVTIQRRLGLARLDRLEPPRPVVRYEHARPGDLVHLDVKKLGRFLRVGHRRQGHRRGRAHGKAGWEYTHVAIDDCTRLAYAEVLPAEDAETAAAFLGRAWAWFAAQGVRVRRLLTDNGGAYRSRVFAAAVRGLAIGHGFTRPYRPQTNGKAERFIRTLLAEWAYARTYRHSTARRAALPAYLHFYNTERRHTALGCLPPAARLAARL